MEMYCLHKDIGPFFSHYHHLPHMFSPTQKCTLLHAKADRGKEGLETLATTTSGVQNAAWDYGVYVGI
jgi:hypothetical protein